MDDRTRPDTNVVLLRRKGDPSEAERERVASTIFAEPDDIATFSRGNLVPPRPDTRDDAEEAAPSPTRSSTASKKHRRATARKRPTWPTMAKAPTLISIASLRKPRRR